MEMILKYSKIPTTVCSFHASYCYYFINRKAQCKDLASLCRFCIFPSSVIMFYVCVYNIEPKTLD